MQSWFMKMKEDNSKLDTDFCNELIGGDDNKKYICHVCDGVFCVEHILSNHHGIAGKN